MFICKSNKLYIQKGSKIVGVDYSLHEISEVEGTEIDLEIPYLELSPSELKAKFNVTELTPYVFPFERPALKSKDEDSDTKTEEVKAKVEVKNKGGRPATKK